MRAIIRTERESRFQPDATRATHVDVADLAPRALRVYLDLMKVLEHGQ